MNELILKSENIIKIIDHTRLNDNDSFSDFISWSKSLSLNYIKEIASVCVYPKFLSYMNKEYKKEKLINKLTTVLNFPTGQDSYKQIREDINIGINNGCDEYDLVIDYNDYLTNMHFNRNNDLLLFVKKHLNAKKHCLKIIIECGKFKNNKDLDFVLNKILIHKPDFIKTSTGKNELWNEDQVILILKKIKEYNKINNKKIGFKLSGGISNLKKAYYYFDLVKKYLGNEYLDNSLFRIGSSKLLNEIIEKNENKEIKN